MIVTVFRSRLAPQSQTEYMQWAKRMSELAVTMPGYVSHKGFVAEDGERLTLVEFESEESMRVWSTHPEHLQAKKKGRQRFFSEYHIQICNVVRESSFKQGAS
jgi:heme-degrading monooxygenase HmoA